MCPIAGGEKRGNLVVVIVATALSLSVRLLLRKEQHSLDSSGKKKTCLCCTSFSFLSFLGSFFCVCTLCQFFEHAVLECKTYISSVAHAKHSS